ncbi:hypothetical protein L6452_44750 [Arctium lappa]|nr:hypothetical protein L6452_44750 [Arctium lappa]
MIDGCRQCNGENRERWSSDDVGLVYQVGVTVFLDLGGLAALLGFKKVSLDKLNLNSERRTLGLSGGLRVPFVGFVVYNVYLGFEVGFCAMDDLSEGCGSQPLSAGNESAGLGEGTQSDVHGIPMQSQPARWKPKPKEDEGTKGSGVGTRGTKEGGLSSNVMGKGNGEELGAFGVVSVEENGVDGGGSFDDNEGSSSRDIPESVMDQVACTLPSEHIDNPKDGSTMQTMQAENTSGGFDAGGNETHVVDVGKRVVEVNVKKTSNIRSNISPPSRDPIGKGVGTKGGPANKPIKGILKNPNRYAPLVEQGGKRSG